MAAFWQQPPRQSGGTGGAGTGGGEGVRAAYTVTVGDVRKASYFGMVLRHRRPLRILLAVLAGCALYAAGGLLGLGTVNPLVFLLGAAYLVWGLLLLAGTERQVLRSLKAPSAPVGEPYACEVDGAGNAVFTLPRRGERAAFALRDLTCAFELSQLFLLYTSPTQTYLLPKRALAEGEQAWLRRTLRQTLGENFGSRFDRGT